MGGGPELERCLDALYVAVRDGAAVDRQAAFDITMNELEYFPLHVEARELAEASVTDGDEARAAPRPPAHQSASAALRPRPSSSLPASRKELAFS